MPFFDPRPVPSGGLHAASTDRNRGPILEVLREILPASGLVLEIASGTGEHAAFFAPLFPALRWQPSDASAAHLESIRYGPFKRGGRHTAESNQRFDEQLRAENPRWGVRDLDDVAGLASSVGFHAPVIVPMPANNLSLVFRAATPR